MTGTEQLAQPREEFFILAYCVIIRPQVVERDSCLGAGFRLRRLADVFVLILPALGAVWCYFKTSYPAETVADEQLLAFGVFGDPLL